jgi:HK97 family phage major capsid protein
VEKTPVQENKTILEKADMALSDLTTGGYLVAAQAQKFIRILIDEGKLLKLATVTPMKSHTQEINKIKFGSRVLRAGAENTALAEADRVKPTTAKVSLIAKLFKAQVNLSYELLEDSIEQDTLKTTIMQLMAEAIARDIDEVLIKGDTNSTDTFLAQFDGILKQVASNVVNAGTVPLTKTILRDMIKTMPSPFLRDKASLRYLTSVDAEIDYRDSLSNRQTNTGDKALDGAAPVGYSGIPVLDIAMFPENLGSGTNETDVVLTDPKNIDVGIWRQIQIETDKDIAAGKVIIVVSLRMDMKMIEETAAVKAVGIKVS